MQPPPPPDSPAFHAALSGAGMGGTCSASITKLRGCLAGFTPSSGWNIAVGGHCHQPAAALSLPLLLKTPTKVRERRVGILTAPLLNSARLDPACDAACNPWAVSARCERLQHLSTTDLAGALVLHSYWNTYKSGRIVRQIATFTAPPRRSPGASATRWPGTVAGAGRRSTRT